jgi:hypothetical protein
MIYTRTPNMGKATAGRGTYPAFRSQIDPVNSLIQISLVHVKISRTPEVEILARWMAFRPERAHGFRVVELAGHRQSLCPGFLAV